MRAVRLMLLLLAVISGTAVAQRNLSVVPANEQRVALVIGNAAYKTAPLSNSVNDASDMASALQSMGFKVILRRNANTREMRQAIREFGVELRRAQVGLFYFAGHGIQVKGDNYLVPVGAEIDNEADAEDSAINANYALRTMEESQVKVSIVILDACRNNPFSRGFRSVSRGLAQMNAATGSLVAFATAPGAVAADGTGRNGVYTKHLLANLREGDADILRVFQRTRAAVVRETSGKQTPWESTSLIGDFYFRAPTGGTQVASAPAAPTVAASPAAPPVVIPPVAGTSFKDCDDCPEMVVIPAGRFTMGAAPGEEESEKLPDNFRNRSQPQHGVDVAGFAAGRFEITRGQYRAFVEATGRSSTGGCVAWNGSKWEMDQAKDWRNPSYAQDDSHPVACVSWDDAKAYAVWMSQKTGKAYRLLTEAEWEYAARAGATTRRFWGDDGDQSCAYANLADQTMKAQVPGASNWAVANCNDRYAYTAPVGSYRANAFGLYDMLGNVWEWTEDCWNENYNGAPIDGSAWTGGNCGLRVLRGGSWDFGPRLARSADRSRVRVSNRFSSFGFRLARMLP